MIYLWKHGSRSYRATAAAGLGAAGDGRGALGAGVVHVCLLATLWLFRGKSSLDDGAFLSSLLCCSTGSAWVLRVKFE